MQQGTVLAMTTNMVQRLILALGEQGVLKPDVIIEMLNRVIDEEQDPNARKEMQALMQRLFPGLGL